MCILLYYWANKMKMMMLYDRRAGAPSSRPSLRRYAIPFLERTRGEPRHPDWTAYVLRRNIRVRFTGRAMHQTRSVSVAYRNGNGTFTKRLLRTLTAQTICARVGTIFWTVSSAVQIHSSGPFYKLCSVTSLWLQSLSSATSAVNLQSREPSDPWQNRRSVSPYSARSDATTPDRSLIASEPLGTASAIVDCTVLYWTY